MQGKRFTERICKNNSSKQKEPFDKGSIKIQQSNLKIRIAVRISIINYFKGDVKNENNKFFKYKGWRCKDNKLC